MGGRRCISRYRMGCWRGRVSVCLAGSARHLDMSWKAALLSQGSLVDDLASIAEFGLTIGDSQTTLNFSAAKRNCRAGQARCPGISTLVPPSHLSTLLADPLVDPGPPDVTVQQPSYCLSPLVSAMPVAEPRLCSMGTLGVLLRWQLS
jgi:hypothetical protein